MSDEKKKAATAAAWARANGVEDQWKRLSRAEKTKVRVALKALKRADRVKAIAEKADARVAAALAVYTKKTSFAQKQIDARTRIQVAEAVVANALEVLKHPVPVIPVPSGAAAPSVEPTL